MDKNGYELRTKSRGDSKEIILRSFVKLDSVEAFLKRLGVNEFKVIINF